MKEPINAVILPTEDKSTVYKLDNETLHIGDFAKCEEGDKRRVNQHLYITVSQNVIGSKEVYYIDKFTNKVTSSGGAEYGEKQDVVIATTDPKLEASSTGYAGDRARTFYEKLPQIQQSFLKEFVANPDGEYEVEYYRDEESMMKNIETKGKVSSWRLKLNRDNTVNITSVKEKMYSLEQMYLSAANVTHQIAANRGNSEWNMKVTPKMVVDNWLTKENL